MALSWEYRSLDRFLLLAAAVLVLMSALFAISSSLVVGVNPDGSLSYAETYNTDDDLCVMSGAIVFAFFLAVAGWWPGHRTLAVIKVVFFSQLWLFQGVFLVGGTEQASIWLSLTRGRDIILSLWLLVFVSSLPCSWFLFAKSVTVTGRAGRSFDPKWTAVIAHEGPLQLMSGRCGS